MDIVQVEQLVVDRKDTIGAVANHFRVGVIATGQREAHSAHENIGLKVNRGAREKQRFPQQTHNSMRFARFVPDSPDPRNTALAQV